VAACFGRRQVFAKDPCLLEQTQAHGQKRRALEAECQKVQRSTPNETLFPWPKGGSVGVHHAPRSTS